MQLLLDDKNVILGFAKLGTMDGATEYTGPVPDDFELKFVPRYYMLKDDGIITNPDYAPSKPNVPTGPNSLQQVVIQQTTTIAQMQQMLTQQATTIAQMQQMLTQQNKDIAELKGANA